MKTIFHEHFRVANAGFRRAFDEFVPGRMIGLCGLPGSGKTHLRNSVLRECLGPPAKWGGKLPATEIMALLPSDSRFSAKAFASRALESVIAPDLKFLYRDTDPGTEQQYLDYLEEVHRVWSGSAKRMEKTEHKYWESFTQSASARGVKWLLVEHAHALCRVRRNEEPTDHMQNLMSVLESVGMMGILTFPPAGKDLWMGRSEIADRMTRIYLKPYRIEDARELHHYASLLLDMAMEFPFEGETVVMAMIKELAIATGTSIRPLRELFLRARGTALDRGSAVIQTIDLQAALPDAPTVSKVWENIRILNLIAAAATGKELLDIHKQHLAST